MKSYRILSKCIAGILALTGALSGCTHEETEDGSKVPLSISASFQAYTGEVSSRGAGNPTVTIALNTTPEEYSTYGKTYQVTSTSPITFTPETQGEALTIAGSAASTPLTIYGWLDENTPVCYTNDNISVSNGNITNVQLSPAYACIGVCIKKDDQREAAGKYTIGSALQRIGTYSTNKNWNTEQAKPQLIGVSGSSTILNTDISPSRGDLATDLPSEYFMRIVPQQVSANFQNLFTVTLPDGTTLSVPSGSRDFSAFEPGYCYLFNVNISRDAELQIEGIETITMNSRVDVAAIDVQKARLGIYTLEDLKAFRDAVNNRGDLARWTSIDTETGKDVINLYMDIDLKNEEWIPIQSFDGTFNGNGHTISNLNLSATKPSVYLGFFSAANSNSEIKGLTIDGVTMTGDNRPVGAIAGQSYGSITDCHLKGRIQLIAGQYAGGIVGIYEGNYMDRKILAACTVQAEGGSITGGAYQGAGCIVGSVGQYSYVIGCIAHDITLSIQQNASLAAIAGVNSGLIYCCLMYNCQADNTYNTGAVTHRMNYCYYYNVFEQSDQYMKSSLEELSEDSFIHDLNRYIEDLGLFACHYKASPTPSETGPTIHMKYYYE
ncbi:hypothetical protein DWW91_19975 [Parabacteroides sp. AF17-3]|uniref:hypothetical protein n=1 Tax=Parabacteroides sp. AF17-3 TaxID=2293113 RepID=UPI000F00F20F|nr:hypothetical protein [Parabacteroides sp. AF17-3]RKU66003.1 hypothetical protein DWW91_19975 [Parabacteroides sp. AF17-3]